MDPRSTFVVAPYQGEIVQRPALGRWLFERNIDLRKAGELLGCSHAQVQIICLPFDDERRRPPKDWLLERIVTLTGGEVGGIDFVQPALRGRSAAGLEAVA